MFNALKKMFIDANTRKLIKAGFLEEDLHAFTKEGVRAMWSILLPVYMDKLLTLADEAIEDAKEESAS